MTASNGGVEWRITPMFKDDNGAIHEAHPADADWFQVTVDGRYISDEDTFDNARLAVAHAVAALAKASEADQ